MSYMVRIPTTYSTNFVQSPPNAQITFEDYKQEINDLIAQFETKGNIHDHYTLLCKIHQILEMKDASKGSWTSADQDKAEGIQAALENVLSHEKMYFPIPIVYIPNSNTPDGIQKGSLEGNVDPQDRSNIHTFVGADGKTYQCYFGLMEDASGNQITADEVLKNWGNTSKLFSCDYTFNSDISQGGDDGQYLGWQFWGCDLSYVNSPDIYGSEDKSASNTNRLNVTCDSYNQGILGLIKTEVSGDTDAVARQCVAVRTDGYTSALAQLILEVNS